MKKTSFLLLTLIMFASSGFGQSKKSQIKTNTDTLWRFLDNTNPDGTATFGFITGSDTTFIQSDGTILNIISSQFLLNGIPFSNQITRSGSIIDDSDSLVKSDAVYHFALNNDTTAALRLDINSKVSATGIEIVTENGVSGWRIIGRDTSKYGNIGNNAVDLSTSRFTSSVSGATGAFSFSEGADNISSGYGAHTEGASNIASATASHAEGISTTASQSGAHSEGNITVASGYYSHAEGDGGVASGYASHCGGAIVDGDSYLEAAGYASFVHQYSGEENGLKKASGDYSAILGGIGNETTSNAWASVVLGGQLQSATLDNTVYVPKLKLLPSTLPTGLGTSDAGLLVFDIADSKLKCWNGTAWISLW